MARNRWLVFYILYSLSITSSVSDSKTRRNRQAKNVFQKPGNHFNEIWLYSLRFRVVINTLYPCVQLYLCHYIFRYLLVRWPHPNTYQPTNLSRPNKTRYRPNNRLRYENIKNGSPCTKMRCTQYTQPVTGRNARVVKVGCPGIDVPGLEWHVLI